MTACEPGDAASYFDSTGEFLAALDHEIAHDTATSPPQASPAVIPPLETEAQALALPQVKAITEAMRASRGPVQARLASHAMLDGALSAAGVKMGAYDHRILMWLAQYEPQVCAVIAGFIQRAAAGRGEQVAR